jgi:hypothetical protein
VILQLAFALGLVFITVVIHALGTLETISHLSRTWKLRSDKPRFLAAEIGMARVVAVLLFLHLVEACVWAALYLIAGILPDFETAIYFSITSYTTVGYGDVVLQAPWRILGPAEAGVGILMFGWSTGIMVTALNRVYGNRLQVSPDQPNDPA